MSIHKCRIDVKMILMICCGWYPLLFFTTYLFDVDSAHYWKFQPMSWWGTRPAIIGMILITALTTAFFTHHVYLDRHLIWGDKHTAKWDRSNYISLCYHWAFFLLFAYAVYAFQDIYMWQCTPLYWWQSRPTIFCAAATALVYALHETYRLVRHLLASKEAVLLDLDADLSNNLESETDGAEIE